MKDHINFLLNGESVKLKDFDPTMTVLQYLRELRRLKGTKEGCAEGDCGACTAVLATLEGNNLNYQAVNTCVQFVGYLNGKALITIEGISEKNHPHPVQQAMVEYHGSQCGFCTPGFVMSMYAGYQKNSPCDRGSIDNILSGNLCRCTGYRPIVKAAEVAFKLPKPDAFEQGNVKLASELKKLQNGISVQVDFDGRRFLAPKNTDDLADILLENPNAQIVAGATDLGLWVTKKHVKFDCLVSIGDIPELTKIEETEGGLRIGTAATYENATPHVQKIYPDIAALIRRIGSVQVRSSGTIGGNIGNGSPIGDTPPALIAARTTLTLRRGCERREIALEDYFLEYGKQDLQPGEFIESVFVPAPSSGSELRCYKISKRFDQDISAVCGAFNLTFDRKASGTVVISARVAFGGMAGTPIRARECETFLIGKPWTQDTVNAAKTVLDKAYTPLSDVRSSASYRRKVAQNLLTKYYLETTSQSNIRLEGRSQETASWTA